MPLIIRLDRTSKQPLYAQIVTEVRGLIESGALKPGDRLPPSRTFATTLGVDRSTVLTSYAELSALGYLRSRQGGYTTVSGHRRPGVETARGAGLIDWQRQAAAHIGKVCESAASHGPESLLGADGKSWFNLATIELDPRLYPLADVRRCLRGVLDQHGADALRYADPAGCMPLRVLLAERLQLHGISASPDEVLITNGAQQGIDLVCRVLGRAGGSVAAELPTYASVLPLLEINGLRVAGFNMGPDGGDIAEVERVLKGEDPVFVYTMPSFQNPTGLTTSHAHRERLLDLARRYRVPIVEDGFEDDMKYEGPVALPVKSIDDGGLVIYLGTFSKVLFPGFRIGWVTADRELIRRLAAVKRYTDLGSNTLGQLFLERFCRQGYYDRHLRRVHREFRRRMRAAMEAAEAFFPGELEWTRPEGGYTIWVHLPRPIDPVELTRRAGEAGVHVSPGGAYFPEGGASEFLRISIARHDEGEIREAFRRLGMVLAAQSQ